MVEYHHDVEHVAAWDRSQAGGHSVRRMVSSVLQRLLVVVPFVVVAACGAEPAPSADSPSTSAEATTTTTTTTTVTTTTTTPAPFAAADGRNLDACADGTCEVFVASGDNLPNASGIGPVQITVQDGMVTIAHGAASGMAGSLSGYPGMPQQINNQVFLIVAVQDGQGVVRLSLA
jgi:hypothetical protein